MKRQEQRVRYNARHQPEIPAAIPLNLAQRLAQDEGRLPPRHAVGGEISDLHLHVGPPGQHDGQIRSERQQHAKQHGIAVPEDHRATAVIEDIPREKDHTRPEGVPVAQNGKPQTGAGAHEPTRMRAPAALQIGRERGNHEEHRRNIRSGIADAAKKIAVEREKQRRTHAGGRIDRSPPNPGNEDDDRRSEDDPEQPRLEHANAKERHPAGQEIPVADLEQIRMLQPEHRLIGHTRTHHLVRTLHQPWFIDIDPRQRREVRQRVVQIDEHYTREQRVVSVQSRRAGPGCTFGRRRDVGAGVLRSPHTD